MRSKNTHAESLSKETEPESKLKTHQFRGQLKDIRDRVSPVAEPILFKESSELSEETTHSDQSSELSEVSSPVTIKPIDSRQIVAGGGVSQFKDKNVLCFNWANYELTSEALMALSNNKEELKKYFKQDTQIPDGMTTLDTICNLITRKIDGQIHRDAEQDISIPLAFNDQAHSVVKKELNDLLELLSQRNPEEISNYVFNNHELLKDIQPPNFNEISQHFRRSLISENLDKLEAVDINEELRKIHMNETMEYHRVRCRYEFLNYIKDKLVEMPTAKKLLTHTINQLGNSTEAVFFRTILADETMTENEKLYRAYRKFEKLKALPEFKDIINSIEERFVSQSKNPSAHALFSKAVFADEAIKGRITVTNNAIGLLLERFPAEFENGRTTRTLFDEIQILGSVDNW